MESRRRSGNTRAAAGRKTDRGRMPPGERGGGLGERFLLGVPKHGMAKWLLMADGNEVTEADCICCRPVDGKYLLFGITCLRASGAKCFVT